MFQLVPESDRFFCFFPRLTFVKREFQNWNILCKNIWLSFGDKKKFQLNASELY